MKKVKWSQKANSEFRETLEYWYEHNKSPLYGERLTDEVEQLSALLSAHPESGKFTAVNNVRAKIFATNFLILYRVRKHHISILRFWDTRRNPKAIKRYFK